VIGDTAFAGQEGIFWLVYGTKFNHSSEQKESAGERLGDTLAPQAEEMGWFRPIKVNPSSSCKDFPDRSEKFVASYWRRLSRNGSRLSP
jgi:hypothetical protein